MSKARPLIREDLRIRIVLKWAIMFRRTRHVVADNSAVRIVRVDDILASAVI